jgi:hypothetical protein
MVEHLSNGAIVDLVIDGFRATDRRLADAGLPTMPLVLPDEVYDRLYGCIGSHQYKRRERCLFLYWSHTGSLGDGHIHIYAERDARVLLPEALVPGTRPRFPGLASLVQEGDILDEARYARWSGDTIRGSSSPLTMQSIQQAMTRAAEAAGQAQPSNPLGSGVAITYMNAEIARQNQQAMQAEMSRLDAELSRNIRDMAIQTLWIDEVANAEPEDWAALPPEIVSG